MLGRNVFISHKSRQMELIFIMFYEFIHFLSFEVFIDYIESFLRSISYCNKSPLDETLFCLEMETKYANWD